MSQQERISKPTTKKAEQQADALPASDKEKREQHLQDIDDLLDEIDGVLEENAEEFVKNYVQKGGE